MKRSANIFVLVLLIAAFSTTAFGWGNATHTYIAKKVTPKGATFDLRAAYAVNLPDMFNLVMTPEAQALSLAMHQTIPTLASTLVDCDARATLYGIVLHGEVCGADYTAHIRSNPKTHSPKAKDGYFIRKGEQLANNGLAALVAEILAAADPSVETEGLPWSVEELSWGIAVQLGHDLAETAVDLLVKDNLDETVGLEMIAAADSRLEIVPQLLAWAYNQDLEFIKPYESAYRTQMIDYGGVMTYPTTEAIQVLAAVQAPVAKMYIEAMLANYGISTTISVAPELVAQSIVMAMGEVEEDYEGELNKTISFIKGNDIPNCPMLAKQSSQEPVKTVGMNAPARVFALEGNFPNPFNPTTTIRYSLPEAARVTLTVYNALGQQVSELVNGELEAGYHSVQFNAAGLASGIYFCRLQAGHVTDTKKLILAR